MASRESAPEPCPDVVELQEHAITPCADSEVTAHVSRCRSCGETLRRITAENELLREFADAFATRASSTPVESLLPRIPGYDLVREIHRGGQGVVYEAGQRSTRRRVAIKVIREGLFADSLEKARFEREVRIMAQLHHPGLVAIHDSGEVSGSPYFVMDYVPGQRLDEHAIDKLLPVREALELFARICAAVNVAHLRGIIHRDIKPGNVRINPAGEPYVLDFGLARISPFDDLGSSITGAATMTGQFVGSLPWASPEQTRGMTADIDVRTDVYSLGVILFQMLTGRFPYDVRGPLGEVLDRIQTADPPRPHRLRNEIDDEVETIVLKCLAKDRERRYQSAGDLERDVRRYLAGQVIDAKRDSGWYVLRKTAHRYRRPLVVASALFVILVGSLALTWEQRRRAVQAEGEARAQTVVLQRSLSENRTQLGRIHALSGNVPLAEDVLWAEFLSQPSSLPGIEGEDQVFWALLELYARYPCVRSLRLTEQGERLMTAQFSADRRTLVTLTTFGVLSQWAIPSFNLLETRSLASLPAHGAPILQSDPLRAYFVSHDAAHIRVTDTEGADSIIAEQTDTLVPFGDRMAVLTRSGPIKILQIGEPSQPRQIVETSGRPRALRFGRDENQLLVLVLEPASTITSWDLQSTPVATATFGERDSGRSLVAMTGDNRCAVALDESGNIVVLELDDNDGRVWSWRIGPEMPAAVSANSTLTRLAMRYLNSSEIQIRDVTTGDMIALLRGHRAQPHFSFTADDEWVVSTTPSDGLAKVWVGPDSSAVRRRIVGEDSKAINSFCFAPDGKNVYCGSAGGRVWQVDLMTGELSDLGRHDQDVQSIALSSDGNRLVSVDMAGEARVWHVVSRTLVQRRQIVRHAEHGLNKLTYVAMTSSGRRAALACDDGNVYVWDLESDSIASIPDHRRGVPTVQFSPDGRWLDSADREGRWRRFDARSLELSRWLEPRGTNAIRAIAFSSDGRHHAMGGDRGIIWLQNEASGYGRTELRKHQQPVFSLAFSPDGRLLASGDRAGRTCVWDARRARELMEFDDVAGGIYSVGFSPDGRLLASTGEHGQLVIRDLAALAGCVAGNMAEAMRREKRTMYVADRLDASRSERWRKLREWSVRAFPK